MIQSKTAELFSAAARIGAVVADRPKDEEDALTSFGTNLGIAFQLVDDALDYSARQAELGKTVGDDFSEGKITLPVILAFRRGTEEDRKFWKRTLEELDQEPGDLEKAQELILNRFNYPFVVFLVKCFSIIFAPCVTATTGAVIPNV